MPQLKSVKNLEELCWANLIRHFDQLQEQAGYLLPVMINQLLDRCYQQFCLPHKKNNIKQLPAKLFIHPATKELHSLNRFDLLPNQVIKKIEQTCKRLQRIKLQSNFIDITCNNPHLIHLDLSRSWYLRDSDLQIVAKHCPQLQHLNLEACRRISDYGMQFLPQNVTHLVLNETNVTEKGCVVALNLLQSLKNLTYPNWTEILNLLSREKYRETYSIEKLVLTSNREPNFDFSNIPIDFFPKLRNIEITFNFIYIPDSLLNNSHCKITLVSMINFSVDIIRIVGHLFPMLEDFTFKCDFADPFDIHFDTSKHVPFKHLRKLSLDFANMISPKEEYLMLFKNCDRLEELRIEQLTDELVNDFIIDIAKLNPLHHLKHLSFFFCDYLSIELIASMVESLHSLKELEIRSCELIWRDQYIKLRELIKCHNWDINLNINFSIYE